MLKKAEDNIGRFEDKGRSHGQACGRRDNRFHPCKWSDRQTQEQRSGPVFTKILILKISLILRIFLRNVIFLGKILRIRIFLFTKILILRIILIRIFLRMAVILRIFLRMAFILRLFLRI